MLQLRSRPMHFSRSLSGPTHLLAEVLAKPTRSATWPDRLRSAWLTVSVWTALGIFQAVPELLPGFQWQIVLAKLIDAWAWALLTPTILIVDRLLLQRFPKLTQISAAHLLLSIPFSLLHSYILGVAAYPISAIWWNPLRNEEFAIHFFLGGWTTYCAMVALFQTLTFYKRFIDSQFALERVETRLLETRLNALRLQLEPHFLFNALNTISSEVGTRPESAREMIDNLSVLLRKSLECQERNEITLAQEVALLDRYIAIQTLRFGDRIAIRIDIDPEMLSTPVPSMLLQPLVENAIRHGLESRIEGGVVIVTARRIGGELHIEVADDGVGLPAHWNADSCTGLGLRVTRERLEVLYPGFGSSRLVLARRKGEGTEVHIRIPLHRVEA